MRSFERMLFVFAAVAAMTIVLLGLFGASEAFGAGGDVVPGTYLNGSISYSDFVISWGNENYSVNGQGSEGKWGNANCAINTPYKIESTSWSFNQTDSQYWNATYFVSGLEVREANTDNRYSSGESNRKGLKIFESSGIGYYDHWPDQDVWNIAYGNLTVSPAEVFSSSYNLNEFPDWNDSDLTRFNATFTVYGQFIRDPVGPIVQPIELGGLSLEPSGNGLSPVPEPSTWALLLSCGATAVGVSIWRKKKRS